MMKIILIPFLVLLLISARVSAGHSDEFIQLKIKDINPLVLSFKDINDCGDAEYGDVFLKSLQNAISSDLNKGFLDTLTSGKNGTWIVLLNAARFQAKISINADPNGGEYIAFDKKIYAHYRDLWGKLKLAGVAPSDILDVPLILNKSEKAFFPIYSLKERKPDGRSYFVKNVNCVSAVFSWDINSTAGGESVIPIIYTRVDMADKSNVGVLFTWRGALFALSPE